MSRSTRALVVTAVPLLLSACDDAATAGGSGGASNSATSTTGAPTSNATGTSSASTGSSSTGGGAFTPLFSPYKDTTIHMDWNTNVISTDVSGATTPLASDLVASGGERVTLAFATGECGSETWAGQSGEALATANVPLLVSSGVGYIVSTGGAAGSFTCASDAGMEAFIARWASPKLLGIDFDIEGGQSQAVIDDLVKRIQAAHAAHPTLRFSLTLATLAANAGASTATELGASAPDSFNTYGDMALSAVGETLGFSGSPETWPSYLTLNLMTMDYGAPSASVCVVANGECDMGESAIQAAYNLHDKWGVPYGAIEITPMIGGNDVASEHFTLDDASTVAAFALSRGLAGVHYWSYDRDVDCPPGPASPTCNSLGGAGPHGFLKQFQSAGLP
ncbi:MAG: glycosyl hydrolase [Polyangiaceae bacterium]